MQRHLTIAFLLLAACSKGGQKEAAAPARTASDTGAAKGGESAPHEAPAAAPPPMVGAAAPTASDTTALEAARNSASLGPSAPTQAFEPLEGAEQAPQGIKISAGVRIDARLASGKRAPALQALFTAKTSRLAACRDTLAVATGTYTIELEVAADGTLNGAKLKSSSVKGAPMAACLIDVIDKQALEKPIGVTKAYVILKFE